MKNTTQLTLLFIRGYIFTSALQDDLTTLNVNLCDVFGGVCQTGSCSTNQMRHKWRVELCTNEGQKCCTQPADNAEILGSSNKPISECESRGGSCHLWYYFNRCSSGMRSNSRCHHRWYSCCLPELSTRILTTSTNIPTIMFDRSEFHPVTSSHPNIYSARCGLTQPRRLLRRIVGGSITDSTPWHVGLRTVLGNIICGGVLISNNWVITASHCLKGFTDTEHLRVVTGNDVTGSSPASNYQIDSFYRHPDYEEIEGSTDHAHKNDIALMKLTAGVVFSETVHHACLPHNISAYTRCYITGWGAQTSDSEMGTQLRRVYGPVMNSTDCSVIWSDNEVDGNMICFGDSSHGACQGDSGGGMFCSDSRGRVSVQGIISWGSATCNQRPTVLTNVAKYLNWIERTMTN